MPNALAKHRERLEAEVQSVLEELKDCSPSQLNAFSEPQTWKRLTLDGRKYGIEVWRQAVADGVEGKFVVLVDVWIKRLFVSYRILRGLLVADDETVTEINHTELWRYD